MVTVRYQFKGCSTYPKCRYTEKLSEAPKIRQKDPIEAAVEAEEAEERDAE